MKSQKSKPKNSKVIKPKAPKPKPEFTTNFVDHDQYKLTPAEIVFLSEKASKKNLPHVQEPPGCQGKLAKQH